MSGSLSSAAGLRTWRARGTRLLHAMLDAVFPEYCAACKQAPAPHLLCDACLGAARLDPGVRRLVAGDVPAHAAWSYSDAVRAAVHRLKFDNQPELARRAARAMFASLPMPLRTPDVVWVPVPLSPSRLLQRGYNQAALLARELALLTGSPAPRHLLVRADISERQSHLDRRARFGNAAVAFSVSSTATESKGAPVRVVLVDDVLTTGATARGCCLQLRAAGFEPVAVVTLAQVDG